MLRIGYRSRVGGFDESQGSLHGSGLRRTLDNILALLVRGRCSLGIRVPYAWPIAHQQLALIRAIAAEGLAASGTGPFTYTRPLYVGRGIPNTWIAAGQTIASTA